MKKINITLSALGLLLTVPMNSFSQYCDYDAKLDGICYQLDESSQTACVTRGPHEDFYRGCIVIPPKIRYGGRDFRVVAIGSGAFSGSENLNVVSIPGSVKYVEDDAFNNCNNLTTIEKSNNDIKGLDNAVSGFKDLNIDTRDEFDDFNTVNNKNGLVVVLKSDSIRNQDTEGGESKIDKDGKMRIAKKIRDIYVREKHNFMTFRRTSIRLVISSYRKIKL